MIGTELVGTSISSDFDEAFIDIAEQAAARRRGCAFEARHRGYVSGGGHARALQADYRFVATVDEPTTSTI